MYQAIEKAESVIKKWDINEGSPSYCRIDFLFTGDRTQAKQFLGSVNNLQSAMQFILLEDPSCNIFVRAQNSMEIAMKRLQKEFHQILSANRAYLDADSVTNISSFLASARSSTSDFDDLSGDENQATISSISETERFSEIAMEDLKSIAETMISTGYGKECVAIYKKIRKSDVNKILFHLGVEKLSSSQIQKMDWDILEIKIKSWIIAGKTAVASLFQAEKIFAEVVFSSSPNIMESCFSDIVKEGARNLFQFPENVAKYKKLSLEYLFRILDFYEALSELLPEIKVIFSYKSLSNIISQAVDSQAKLGEAVRYMLADFEAAIRKDISKSPVTGGGIHPLTKYVMNYMVVLSDYSRILSDILIDSQLMVRSPMPETYFSSPLDSDDPGSVISNKFAWIILVLLCKLNVKAELFQDVALSYLFLANNLNYVVLKVKSSSLKLLLGNEWLVNREKKVKQFARNYERIGWSKAISSLALIKDESSMEELKESIGVFCTAFEEAYRKQRSWVVPERKLRDDIKVSLAKKLGPAYQVAYKKYQSKMKGQVGVECSVRYSPDNLGNYLSDLFYGDGIQAGAK